MSSLIVNLSMDIAAFFIGTFLWIIGLPLLIFRRIVFGKRSPDLDSQTPVAGRCVLITGCDTGLGKASVARLLQVGYTVFAGCLDAKAAATATFSEYKGLPNFHVVQLNVSKQQEVDAAVKQVSDWLDNNPVYRLWAIVNNAGSSIFCPFEFLSMESLQGVLDVNYLGAVRVTKAFLPVLRRGGHRGGRIVNVGGIAGDIPLPMSSYASSKAALLLLSDVLRIELSPRFGIDVSAVVPDAYATEMFNVDRNLSLFNREVEKLKPEIIDAYGGQERIERMRQVMLKNLPNMAKKDISPVLSSIVQAVGSSRPNGIYYPIDTRTSLLKLLYRVSPVLYTRLVENLPGVNTLVY